jgi:hypothetical protein
MSTELDEILANQSSNNTITSNRPDNPVANFMYKLGLGILVVGIIAGIIIITSLTDPNSEYSFSPDPHPLRWVYGISLIVSSFISGIMFIGFGEIIWLLTHIKENTKKQKPEL